MSRKDARKTKSQGDQEQFLVKNKVEARCKGKGWRVMRAYLDDGLLLLGAVLVTAGAGMMYLPAALVTAGVFCLAAAVLVGRSMALPKGGQGDALKPENNAENEDGGA